MGNSEDNAAKLVTVLVQNASANTITLSQFLLWGNGVWEPGGAPTLGQTLGYGITLLNGASTPYDSFGGSVTFVPSDGGTLTAAWNWAAGQSVQPSANGTSSTLAITCWTANASSNNPTVNFKIAPAIGASGIA